MKVLHAAGLAAVLAPATPMVASATGPPAPIDPQNWSFQDNLTWSDYHALPGTDYSNPDIQPTVKKWKVALVVTDFDDKPFYLSQPAGTPQAINHFQTMNRYWMEDSFGKYGVQLDAFGPYCLPGHSYQYSSGDALRTGAYAKTLTFTLSTTTP